MCYCQLFECICLLTGGWDMCGGNVGLGGLGAVGTGAEAGTGGGIGAGASVAGFEICPPVSGGDPPAPFAGGNTCGEEDGNSSAKYDESRYILAFNNLEKGIIIGNLNCRMEYFTTRVFLLRSLIILRNKLFSAKRRFSRV